MEHIQAISYILNFHKIFGYIPIQLKQKFSKSFLTYIYGCIILIVYTALLIFDRLQPSEPMHQINFIINLLKLICSAINIYINILSTWMYSNTFSTMLKKLCKLLNKFKQLGILMDTHRTNRFGWIIIVISIIVLIVVGVISWTLQLDVTVDLTRFMLLFIPLILNTFTITQIAIWCYLFGQCFENINKLLQFRLSQQYNRISTYVKTIGATNQSLIYNNLDEIGKSYFLMKEILEDFTQIYACQDLAIFATSFTVNTCFLYYFVYVSTDIETKIYLLTWIAFHSLEIFINVLTRHSVEKKINIFTDNLFLLSLNEKDDYQMSILAMKLKVNPIKFKPMDVLEINPALIHSILASVCTYLIIIMQFRISTPSSSPNSSNDLRENKFSTPTKGESDSVAFMDEIPLASSPYFPPE